MSENEEREQRLHDAKMDRLAKEKANRDETLAEIARLKASNAELLAACEALPDFDTDNADAADYKDNAGAFARAMELAKAAIAKARGSNLVIPGEGDDAACESCHGYGYFNDSGDATPDRRGRKCLDCTGTGIAHDK